jgi:hypothetical protein
VSLMLRNFAWQTKRSTKTHKAEKVLFVPFRVISWIVLVQAERKHETRLGQGRAASTRSAPWDR